MKSKTRDNLIYLAVGLSIAALVAADVFYAVSHDREIMIPPMYVLRAAGMALITPYFVGRALRSEGVTITKAVVCAVVAGVLQLAICFGFRQFISLLSGLPFVVLATVETFSFVSLATWVASRLSRRHCRPGPSGSISGR